MPQKMRVHRREPAHLGRVQKHSVNAADIQGDPVSSLAYRLRTAKKSARVSIASLFAT